MAVNLTTKLRDVPIAGFVRRRLKCPTSTLLCVIMNEALESERYARKRVKHECSVRIKIPIPRDHYLASPANPRDPRNGIFYPHLTPM